MSTQTTSLVQCRLQSGTARMVTMVPADPRLRPGVSVRLKDSETPDTWWTVAVMSQPIEKSAIFRGWNNNI